MKGGYSNDCKDCKVIYNRKRREMRAAGEIPFKEVSDKKCTVCSKVKPVSEFFREAASANGYSSQCKECKTALIMEWRAKNKETYNKWMREYHKANYHKLRLNRYGLSVKQHEDKIKQQQGLCEICGAPSAAGKPLLIDHHHETDMVRGLLCYKCNRDMAPIDEPEHLAKLLAYYAKYNKA
jgi:hypothetical protein